MIKLLKYLKPYKFHVVAILALLFTQAIAELYLPTLMSDIINKGIVNADNSYIWETGIRMILISALSGIAAVLATLLATKSAVGYGTILRKEVFHKVEGFSLNEVDKIGTASLITRTTNDITQIQQVMIMILRMMLYAPIMSIGAAVMAIREDSGLAWVILVVIPVIAVVIGLIMIKALPLFKIIQSKVDKLNLVLRENLTGMRVIRAFNKVEYEKNRFDQANEDLTDTNIKVNKIMAWMMPALMLIFNLVTICIIWFGGKRIDTGDMQVGSLLAFIQYIMQMMFSILMLTMMFVLVPRAQASAQRINEVLDTELEIKDTKEAKDGKSMKGYIEFKNVTFRYPGAEEPVLENISFSAKPGETTAIIGGTGSGKSTLVNLIPRFYDVEKGDILVDGVSVKELSQENLRKKIGFIPQKAVLFSGTIRENLKYGKEDATDTEIAHAANIAQAESFISELSDGYDSYIAQGGNNVSGGQKQRLSIARALIRKPEIYVFDDSFSALDFKTDAKLRAALKGETKDATVIIVAQRVTTVMDADRIIVLEDGNIVGIGTHKELLQENEVYREIVSSQLSEEELA